MSFRPLLIAAILASGALSACAPQPGQPGMFETQSGRAVVGALAGAAIADNQDENALAGAALGAAAGALTCGIPGLPPCEGI
jgi:hypothetical protein